METKELKIQIPKVYCIDESKSTFEKIVFKKKDTKPRSWEEYGKAVLRNLGYKDTCGGNLNIILGARFPSLSVGVQDTKFLQEHTAFIKLCMLRKAWIKGWKPDWYDDRFAKWCVTYQRDDIYVLEYKATLRSLSFPTKEMAEDFMNTFKDLLEIAKPLI